MTIVYINCFILKLLISCFCPNINLHSFISLFCSLLPIFCSFVLQYIEICVHLIPHPPKFYVLCEIFNIRSLGNFTQPLQLLINIIVPASILCEVNVLKNNNYYFKISYQMIFFPRFPSLSHFFFLTLNLKLAHLICIIAFYNSFTFIQHYHVGYCSIALAFQINLN